MLKKISAILVLLAVAGSTYGQVRHLEAPVATKKEQQVATSYAWRVFGPLGDREPVGMDTTLINYSLDYVPAITTPAYATTGNYGGEGETMIYFDRKNPSNFFFRDAIRQWIPTTETVKFYNTRIPMTLLSYNFGGGKEASQERLKCDFSGNINKRAQIGAFVDYLYSKGSFNYQAAKDLAWGFSGSYLGERYEFQGFYRHFNLVNKDNGGIIDDRYITDPAEVQGGSTKVDFKTVPTNLTDAHNRNVGSHLYLNNRYKLGFHREVETEDSVVKEFVPVTSIIWILDYDSGRHHFINTNQGSERDFWENTYFTVGRTSETASYWQLRNTVGLSLLEGFNKYAKAGLSVFMTHEFRNFKQPHLDLPEAGEADGELASKGDTTTDTGLTPLPVAAIPTGEKQNLIWIGAQLVKRQGKILNYEATGELGMIGEVAGEVKLNGKVTTHIPLFKDTVNITGYGDFTNLSVPYFLQHYVSNHFIWNNDFGKTRRLRFGGELSIPRTHTSLNIGIENVQNLVYFNAAALPEQCASSVQVFSATLHQNFKIKAFNWENTVIFQTSTNEDVIPLPKLAINTNMYVLFKVAKVFKVQLGIDCDYYTRYKAVDYQPATMAFYNQNKVDCGGYPYMNAYINMKLSKTHFYIMLAHFNQGLFGKDEYFSMPHYPLNPRRLQMGLSIDFSN